MPYSGFRTVQGTFADFLTGGAQAGSGPFLGAVRHISRPRFDLLAREIPMPEHFAVQGIAAPLAAESTGLAKTAGGAETHDI